MENWKVIAYLLAFGQGLILSLALVVKGVRRQRAHLFLGLILLVLTQELLNAWAMQIRYHSRPDAFHFWNFQSYLVLPLALWFFLRHLTQQDFAFKRVHGLYFAPVALEIAIRWSWQLSYSVSERPIPSLLSNPVWFFMTEILPILGMVAVLAFFGYGFWLKTRNVEVAVSPQFLLVFSFFAALTALWISGVVLELPVFTGIEVLITVSLLAMGYAGYIHPDFLVRPAFTVTVPQAAEKPDFSRFDDERALRKLNDYFTGEQPYMQPGLSLDAVAGHLRLPARYISHLINAHCGTNFSGFVNGFRVKAVLSKLSDPKEKHKTILALAFEAGFNSKSTFNQVFKQHTGHSPSQLLLNQKQANDELPEEKQSPTDSPET